MDATKNVGCRLQVSTVQNRVTEVEGHLQSYPICGRPERHVLDGDRVHVLPKVQRYHPILG